MPIRCEHATAHLMELLYGELPPGERASIENHLADCARCRAEVASFQRTRTLARQALDDDTPPARVRNAILQAAAAARPVASQMEKPLAQPSERSSWWDWLRSRWTLPTLATVGAVAVFLLGSRLLLDPAKTYDRGRRGLSTPASEPAQTEPRQEPTLPSGGAMDVPSPAVSESREKTPAAPASAYRRHVKAPSRGKAAGAPMAPAPEDEFATPPPPRTLTAPAGEPPGRPMAAPRKAAPKLEQAGGSPAGSAGEQPTESRAAEAPLSPSARGLTAAPSAPSARRGAAAPVAPDPSPAPPEETLAARADRLFSEGLWAEAADAYRALLRSDPRGPEAERWRQRLAAALRASANGTARAAPAKR